MKPTYCPHCGAKNQPGSQYCLNCGFNLQEYRRQFQIQRHQRIPKTRPMTSPRYPHRKRHFYSVLITGILIVVVIFIGIGAYSNDSWPFGNGPVGQMLGQSTQRSAGSSNRSSAPSGGTSEKLNHDSKSRANNKSTESVSSRASADEMVPIKTFWQHVDNRLDSDSGDNGSSRINYLFQNSTDNDSLNGIKNWLSFVSKADCNNDTQVVTIKPYDFSSGNNGTVHFKVKYDFKLHADSSNSVHHIQIFSWHATVDHGKIVTMKSPKQPTVDYKKK